MTQRRRTSSKRKTTRTRNKGSQDHKITQTIWLLIGILVSVLGIFQLGLVGVYVADIVRFFTGNLYIACLAPLSIYLIYILLFRQRPKIAGHYWLGAIMGLISLLTISSLMLFTQTLKVEGGYASEVIRIIGQDFMTQSAKTPVGGGMIGALCYQVLQMLVANIGTWILSILLLMSGVIVFFRIPARDIAQLVLEKAKQILLAWQDKRQQQTKSKSDRKQKNTADATPVRALNTVDMRPSSKTVPDDKVATTEFTQPEIKWNRPTPEPEVSMAPSLSNEKENKTSADDDITLATEISSNDNPDYQLPNPELLTPIPPTDQTAEFNQLTEKSRIVHDTLKSFNIDAEVTSVSLGPTVTQYELKPAVGVKVSRIANLADDLAMALAAKSIRIEAPIPGKPYVGIEVPNETQATVGFRDMVESAPQNNKPLTVPLGRDVTGNIIMADLQAMPHLLIAGSTGSGKSVAINGIIASLLLKAKPNEVKLMMVDPKKVELSVYNGIPHLLTPVVSEPRKAAKALQKVVTEMERRYELFAQFGMRNIAGYNKAVDQQNEQKPETTDTVMQRMPYIVAIVDELADLMMTVSGEVEPAIIRIAQMGRAAGIHLILATQRPSVDVITGLIKANVPSRVAFAVSSGTDSRTILDANGAEKLLGRGDMIFAPLGKVPQRVQGAFISDSDVENLVDFVKSQQEAEYVESMTVTDEEVEQNGQNSAANSEDELFQDALNFVIQQQKASTSLLQRRFRIGYNRAARLIDDLESGGYIGPADGSRPRHVNIQDGSSGTEH